MVEKVKPSFSKDYANKVGKSEFIEHFKPVYDLTEAELSEAWESLQDKPKEAVKADKKAEK